MPVTETSLDALKKSNADVWRERVLAWLVSRGGKGTLWQACLHFGKPKHALSGRFTELAQRGLIQDSKDRLSDPASGVGAKVWELVTHKPKQLNLF